MCGCGWEVRDFGKKKMCFKFIGNHRIGEARQKCLDLGAALPLPRSDTEQADLIKIVDHLGAESVVLGANEQNSGVYVDSVEHPLTYTAWNGASPTNLPHVTMKFNMKWRAEPGYYNSNIICVKCHPSYYRGPHTFSEIFLLP